jgi:hypothetical protein
MACPRSVSLIRQAPAQETSEYAAEVTAAHDVAAVCLTNMTRPEAYLGTTAKGGFEVTDEMVEAIGVYLDTINSICSKGKFIQLFEVKFDLGIIFPGLFGTADCVLISSDLKKIYVLDFKYGAGVPVEVKENKQLLYYVLGAINYACMVKKFLGLDDPSLFGWHQTFEEIHIGIVQPRCRHKDGAVRLWQVPKGYLDTFADDLKAAAALTEDPKAPLCAGKHCKFCPAMSICPEIGKVAVDAAQADFAIAPARAQLALPDSMTVEQVSKILQYSDLIQDWLKAVEAHALLLAEHGEAIPGYKLVKKKANRAWVASEAEVADMLGLYLSDDKIWTKKLVSPAQAEKCLKGKEKQLLADLYETPDNGNTLAPEHDKRPEVAGSAETDFKVLT